jgi:hypothetical protein
MHPTVIVDLQCVSFEVEGELEAKTVEGRGGDGASISEEKGRGHESVEGRRDGDMAARLWALEGDDALRGGRWLS